MRLVVVVFSTLVMWSCDKSKACDDALKTKVTSDSYEQVISMAKGKCEGEKAKLVSSVLDYVAVLKTLQHQTIGDAFAGKSIQDYLDDAAKLQVMMPGKSLQQVLDETAAWGRETKTQLAEVNRKIAEKEQNKVEIAKLIQATFTNKMVYSQGCSEAFNTTIITKNDWKKIHRISEQCQEPFRDLVQTLADSIISTEGWERKLLKPRDVVVGPNEQAKFLYDLLEPTYGDVVILDFVFENASSKRVDAFQGNIVVRDKLSNLLATIPLKHLSPIEAKAKQQVSIRYAEERGADASIANGNKKDLKVTFEFDRILFADGSSLGMESSTAH